MKKIPVVILAVILWITLGSLPVLCGWPAQPTLSYFQHHMIAQAWGQLVLLGLLAGVTGFLWISDTGTVRGKIIRYGGCALLAGLVTDIHYDMVDYFHFAWQLQQFQDIFAHTCLPPDQYRFLSQGTLWWMTLIEGNFVWAYVLFRFFFTFLLCLSIYRLARLYVPAQASMLIVFMYGAFYTLSTRYYNGNLLDPMSHLAMFTAFYYCRQRKFRHFFWVFLFGVFVKETMLLLAPCYFLMNLETGRPASLHKDRSWQRILLLSLAGMAVFFACRLPFHFDYNFQTLNRTPGSMIWANLGIGHAPVGSPVSVLLRYLHPILFLFMWLPLIITQRRFLPVSLFWTSLYFAAALYATNTCFGWNYESRNFVPGLVLLLICTMIIIPPWLQEQPATVDRPQ